MNTAEAAENLASKAKTSAAEALTIANSAKINAQDAKTAASEALENLEGKMGQLNPMGTGSFSMNRLADSAVGDYSVTSGFNSCAVGSCSSASGLNVITGGDNQTATGRYNIAEVRYEEAIDPQSSDYVKYGTNWYISQSYTFDPFTGMFTLINPAWRRLASTGFDDYFVCKEQSGSSIYRLHGGYDASGKTRSSRRYYSKALMQNYAHIVGNGESDTTRSNAYTLDWDGNAWYAGDVYVGSEGGVNRDGGSKKLATEEFVEEATSEEIASQIGQHNESSDAHENMGWLTGEDEEAGEPTPIDADTLGGHRAEYFNEQIAVERARIDQIIKNGPGENNASSALTSTEKNLILSLFRNTTYVSNDIKSILEQLVALWSDNASDENPIKYYTIQGYPPSNSGGFVGTTGGETTVYFQAAPGEQYIVSRSSTSSTKNRFRISFSATEPKNGVATFGFSQHDESKEINVSVPSGANYVIVYVGGTVYPTIPEGFAITKIS